MLVNIEQKARVVMVSWEIEATWMTIQTTKGLTSTVISSAIIVFPVQKYVNLGLVFVPHLILQE
jgi:hypothetical protein